MVPWFAQGQVCTVISRGEDKLFIGLNPVGEGRWAGIALVTKESGKGVEAVLSNHSHSSLGVFDSLEEALEAGETYLEKWQLAAPEPACPCKEIDQQH